jgi:nicotinate-nucleotide adenylyltransferase
MRLGIFGGTFDPPHVGHLILADNARVQLNLERILWMLTPNPPHKADQVITPLVDRLDMLQAALGDDPHFELSRVDIYRPPPHYAVDTMRLLRQRYPGDILVYLVGADSLVELPTWHAPREFVLACDEIGVMRRFGEELDLQALEGTLPGLKDRLRWVHAPLVEIASTQIRRAVCGGGAFRYELPPQVYQIICQRGLYLCQDS